MPQASAKDLEKLDASSLMQSGQSVVAEDGLCGDPGVEILSAGREVTSALSCFLSRMSSAAKEEQPGMATKFDAGHTPNVCIRDYLLRLRQYFFCSDECYVVGLVYIDRIVNLHPEFSVAAFNIHKLLLTSVLLATKFFEDRFYSNLYYSKVGGVSLKDLNSWEEEFLRLMHFQLCVLPEEYNHKRAHVLAAEHGQDLRGHRTGQPWAAGLSPRSPQGCLNLARDTAVEAA